MTIRIPRSCGSGSWDSCGSLPAQRPSLVAAVENLGTFSSFTRQDRAAQHKALPESAPHVPFAMPTEITCLEVIGSGSQGVVFKGEAIPKWHLLLPPPPHTTTTTTRLTACRCSRVPLGLPKPQRPSGNAPAVTATSSLRAACPRSCCVADVRLLLLHAPRAPAPARGPRAPATAPRPWWHPPPRSAWHSAGPHPGRAPRPRPRPRPPCPSPPLLRQGG